MLVKILRKRAQLLSLALVLSLLLTTATTAFAETKLVKAKDGGTVKLGDGCELKIGKYALKEDIIMSAEKVVTTNYIDFSFGPDGTEFTTPARLKVSMPFLKKVGWVDDFTLYGDNGEELQPDVYANHLEYNIHHFSIYYFRRR